MFEYYLVKIPKQKVFFEFNLANSATIYQNFMGKNYYEILGVSRDADATALKKAYRKLALRWHPDKNPNNQEEAQKKFQEITEAFSILNDPEKRRTYDQFGEEGLNNGNGGNLIGLITPLLSKFSEASFLAITLMDFGIRLDLEVCFRKISGMKIHLANHFSLNSVTLVSFNLIHWCSLSIVLWNSFIKDAQRK